MNTVKSLNELYQRGKSRYWCNCTGDIYIPGDAIMKCGSVEQMPPKVREIYEGLWEPGLHPTYVFEDEYGNVGLAFGILFDQQYITDLRTTNPYMGAVDRKAFEKECFNAIKRMAEDLTKRLPYAQVYLGEGTDPDGDEILVFVPKDEAYDLAKVFPSYMGKCEEIYHEFEGLLTDRLIYKGKTVGLSIKTLYEKYGNALLGGGDYRAKIIADGGEDYYDLCLATGGIICCDGEEVEVVDVDAEFVHFISHDGEDDVEFRLTREEFGVARYTDANGSESITYADLSAAANILFKTEDGPHKKVAHLLLKFIEERDILHGGEFADIIDRNSAKYLVTSVVNRVAIKARLVNRGYAATDANVDLVISHMDLDTMRISLNAKIDVAILAATDAGDLNDNT